MARRPKYAQDERVEVECFRCKAPAGSPCRNYQGQAKQTCEERGDWQAEHEEELQEMEVKDVKDGLNSRQSLLFDFKDGE